MSDTSHTGPTQSQIVTEVEAQIRSALLLQALQDYFRRWEHENGFRPGAGVILLPAGWNER